MRAALPLVVLLGVVLSPFNLRADSGSPIVAVFNIEVKGIPIGRDTIERLSVYLSGRIAASGRHQVVPREKLKERLVAAKKSSYEECYSESCQIELGRELAAQKTIATQVVKVGSSCAVTLTVFDLARAASEAGASARGGCTEDAIVISIEDVVGQITGIKVASTTSLNGRWAGSLVQPDNPPGHQQHAFELELVVNGNRARGTSKITAGIGYGIMELDGTVEGSVLSWHDGRVIDQKINDPQSRWCKKSGSLTLKGDRLEGYFTAPNCRSGEIELTRVR